MPLLTAEELGIPDILAKKANVSPRPKKTAKPKDPPSSSSDKPMKNQPLDYYLDYVRELSEDGNIFARKAGYIRWRQGHAFLEAAKLRAKGRRQKGDVESLCNAADVPRSTYYACCAIAGGGKNGTGVTEKAAKLSTWTEMLVFVGYITNHDKPKPKNDAPKTLDKEPVVVQERATPRDAVDKLETNWKEFAEVECKKPDDREYCITKLREILTGINGMMRAWGE